jgi:hypothetical protein
MVEQHNFQDAELENDLLNFDDEDAEFENEVDNMIFAMRTCGEFYSYPKLMEMSKKYNSINDEGKKSEYLESIPKDLNPELEKSLGFKPSVEILEMLFKWLSVLDQDFLVGVANLVKDEKTALLFEGMVYMGLSFDEEELSE